MKQDKSFEEMENFRQVLGDDFWEMISEFLPFIGPRVDLCRGEKEVIVVAEIPGIESQSELTISLHGYTLNIEGKILKKYASAEYKFLLKERSSGSFSRSISLPKDCALEHIRADYHNGLLVIQIPLFVHKSGEYKEQVNVHFHQ
ncbi:Hsp20/alpha crystallin family protein [Aquibacillus sp. 3ASR75-11]|uniref:Hsp20/alpha crystallin family protein n=1 Tax=Terrihalobacillus insolitus TaxID=2950438 RepID=A0A9X4AMQ2_9BACI|nr:Hsp20/alpha crystallin family protein [Terrihalobacillus insolitus]MDC3413717.1 Hsp20/alpha crystallin family protein [Terrihalobacillus insolitus]MDC3425576.1 Hsp20/alpha crystallin family protein [Terrihalobacillus insolitus]